MKVKAYTGFGKPYRTLREFELVERLPKVGEEYNEDTVISIEEIWLDSEQANDDAYNYEYYSVVCEHSPEDEEDEYYTENYSVAFDRG